LAGATPPATFAYSLMSGREPFANRPLSQFDRYPLENFPTADLAISKFLGRPVSTTRKFTDERGGLGTLAADLLGGVKITNLAGGPERARHIEARRALNEVMSELPHLREHSTFFANPEMRGLLTPEEAKDLRLQAGLDREGKAYGQQRKVADLFQAARF